MPSPLNPTAPRAQPPAWSTAALNPIALDPALQNVPSPTAGASNGQNNAGPSFSRFLPQQQHPPGTSTSSSYPNPTVPAAPSNSYSQYYPTPTSAYTSGGFVRSLPPSSYAPYTPTSHQYNPAPPAAQPVPQLSALASGDPNELNDVLGSAGVDVRAENEALQRSHEFYQPALPNAPNAPKRSDKTKKQTFIDPHLLGPSIRSIAAKHNITKVTEDSINYSALALRERLLGLINTSLQARNHRQMSTVARAPGMYADGTTPMWAHVVRRDIARQLSAIEKVDREEEQRIRRERHERLENPTGVPSGGGDSGTDDNGKKRKRQKEMGPGVTARTMSEETRKKLVDDAASRAVGGGKRFAWMTAAATPGTGANAPARKPPVVLPSATNGIASSRPIVGGGGWSRTPLSLPGAAAAARDEEIRTLTLRDVDFAIDREKGHGGGRGSARGWT